MNQLTPYALDLLDSGAIIATGLAPDSPEGIHMTGSGRMLRWVAKRGDGAPDWAIYCHHEEHDETFIMRMGDKVRDEETIKRLVPCNDAAYARYRR